MADFERNLVADAACEGWGGGYEVKLQFTNVNLRPQKFPIGSRPLPTESYEEICARLEAERSGLRLDELVAVEAWRECQKPHDIDGNKSSAWRSRLERQFAGFVADRDKIVEVKPGTVDAGEYGASRSGRLRRDVGKFATGTRVVLLATTPFERNNCDVLLVAPALASQFSRPILVGLRTGVEEFLMPTA